MKAADGYPQPRPFLLLYPRVLNMPSTVRLSICLQGLEAADEKSARLAPRVESLETANDALRAEAVAARSRCSEAELQLAQVCVRC